eukprot:gene39201-47698_t
MLFARLLVLLAVLACALANYVRMEPSVGTFSSSAWLKEGKLQDNDVVRAVFVLKHDPMAVKQFEANLLDIATPSSKNYGQWLNAEDVLNRLSPSEDKVNIVKDYLISAGVKAENIKVNKFRNLIQVDMPAATASEVLRTEFALFRSAVQRDVVLPRITKPYYLPERVADVVSIVDDIMRFPALRDAPKAYGAEIGTTTDPEFSSCGSKCNGFTTPAVLQSRYGYPTVNSVASGNSMSVAEFQYQYYDNTDLKSFSGACGVTATVDTTIGGNQEKICEAGGCVEALLDIEYIEA